MRSLAAALLCMLRVGTPIAVSAGACRLSHCVYEHLRSRNLLVCGHWLKTSPKKKLFFSTPLVQLVPVGTEHSWRAVGADSPGTDASNIYYKKQQDSLLLVRLLTRHVHFGWIRRCMSLRIDWLENDWGEVQIISPNQLYIMRGWLFYCGLDIAQTHITAIPDKYDCCVCLLQQQTSAAWWQHRPNISTHSTLFHHSHETQYKQGINWTELAYKLPSSHVTVSISAAHKMLHRP